MDFETQLPEWKNEGTEPSDDLKTNGFKEGYKPPAGVFNWFWSLVTKAIKELQTKLENDISMEGNKITNVGEPELRSDVATRGFVEDFSIEGSTYVAVDENEDGNVVLRPYVPLVDDPVDEVVEQGTKEITQTLTNGSSALVNWTYTKWKSGRCELCGSTIRAYDFSGYDITGGNIIRSDALSVQLPFKVYAKRTFFDCEDINAWASATYDGDGENYATCVLWRRYDYGNVNYKIFVRVEGSWK